jgi:hypothetical protein
MSVLEAFEAEVLVGETVPVVRTVGGQMTTTLGVTFYSVTMRLVKLTNILRELGVEPLPVSEVIEAVERERGLPFCKWERERLISSADEVFALPIFTHTPTRQLSALSIHTSDQRPPARLMALWGACKSHYTAAWSGREVADLIIVTSIDLTALIALLAKIASTLTVIRPTTYLSAGAAHSTLTRRLGISFNLDLPDYHAFIYDEASSFVERVRAEGGIEGVTRSLLAELAVDGARATLIESALPSQTMTVDELLGRRTLQVTQNALQLRRG